MIVAGLGLAAAITRHGILERSGVAGARSSCAGGRPRRSPSCLRRRCSPARSRSAAGIDDPAASSWRLVRRRLLGRRQRPGLPAGPRPSAALRPAVARGGARRSPARDGRPRSPPPAARAYLAGSRPGSSSPVGRAGPGGAARHHERGDTRRALRVGLPTIPHQVAIYLASGALVLLAGHLFGTADAGRLQLAVLIGSAPAVSSPPRSTTPGHRWSTAPHPCTGAWCSSGQAATSPR